MRRRQHLMVEQSHSWLVVRWWLAALGLSIGLLGLEQTGITHQFRGVIERGFGVIDGVGLYVNRVMSWPQDLVASPLARAERIARLEERLAKRLIDQAELDYWRAFSESGAASVAVTPGRSPRLWAQLISYQDSMYVSAGEVDGVSLGSGVSSANGQFVGRIAWVGRYVSQVDPVGVDDLVVPVKTHRGALGVVMQMGNELMITEVLTTDPLEVGDVVLTSGADGLLPPDLIVGEVASLVGRIEEVVKGGVVERLPIGFGFVGIW